MEVRGGAQENVIRTPSVVCKVVGTQGPSVTQVDCVGSLHPNDKKEKRKKDEAVKGRWLNV